MGCREKRGRAGVLVPFGATFKCVRLCFFNTMQLSAPFLREMPRAGGHIGDGHHDSYPNWVGCAVNAW